MRAKHLLAVMSFLFVSTAMVQAQSSWRARNYDPSTETTVKGTVEQVKLVSGRRGGNGTHLLLKTDVGSLEVHAGPPSYITSQGFSFAKGDDIEVLGSKVKLGENEALIAREVKKEDNTLVLRRSPRSAAMGGRAPGQMGPITSSAVDRKRRRCGDSWVPLQLAVLRFESE